MFAIKTKEYIKNHPGTNLAIAMSAIINKDTHKEIYKALGNVRTSINIKTPYAEFFVRDVSDELKKQTKIFIIRVFEDKIQYTNFKMDREDVDYARTIFSKNLELGHWMTIEHRDFTNERNVVETIKYIYENNCDFKNELQKTRVTAKNAIMLIGLLAVFAFIIFILISNFIDRYKENGLIGALVVPIGLVVCVTIFRKRDIKKLSEKYLLRDAQQKRENNQEH